MKLKYSLIIIILIWIIIQILMFYELPYFAVPFVWLIVCIVLFIICIRNLVLTIKNKKNLNFKPRIIKLTISLFLFFFTIYQFNHLPQLIIGKIDWTLLKNKRIEIIEDVKSGKLQPNRNHNSVSCKLPFECPKVSHGGNEISIIQNPQNQFTIKFYIFRNFFEAPSSYLIYSEIQEDIDYYEKLIDENPARNWKVKKNWYRVMYE